ncbi:ATP-binding cassette domain-containing protein [Streptomyces sp. LE64]|uniref:ATP-binding cassette domain-containing protein n=1 Tax=Streptomyces sp. LE64 TaxID=3448653 RepID=UPI004041C767
MIQAIGLTSTPHDGGRTPTVDNVSFEAPTGRITALLGEPGAGTSTVLRLLLELQPGRGVGHFRGRPLHRIPDPAREVGVVLGDVPGHPARSVRGHLRMLCAAAGASTRRADEVLEAMGLDRLGDERLGRLSRDTDRRLALACALLADPHTLVLDAPSNGLSLPERRWLHGLLRTHASCGGTVLFTTDDAKEAARHADRVVTLDAGRVIADQETADFARTRLRPRVVVRSPQALRLAQLITKEARAARRPVEVRAEDGNRLAVYGSDCPEVGEAAYRHGILLHQLADETADAGTPDPLGPAAEPVGPPAAEPPPTPTATGNTGEPEDASPPAFTAGPPRPPLHPIRYELRRATGIATGYRTCAAALLTSAVLAVVLGGIGHTPQPRLLAGWPEQLPLPPAALAAGLLGALAFGDEYRHPALAAHRGTVPRRLGLLGAKMAVAAVTALVLAVVTAVGDAALLHLLYGPDVGGLPERWATLTASWLGLVTGCAWAGVLAAGLFRSTAAGLAAVLAVPVLVVPLVQRVLSGPSVRSVAGLPARLHEFTMWPFGAERYLAAAFRVIAQPVGGALALSLTALLGAYLLIVGRSRVR